MNELEFRSVTQGELGELVRRIVAANHANRAFAPAAFAPNDPHWKRVAKDRAKRKAAKKHKQHMRRMGKA